ncbi:MAG: hypothetical protein ABI300_08495 [Rhodanobacter sp.]
MAVTLFLAAAIFMVMGVVHSVLGEKYILVRLFRRKDLPALFGSAQFTTRTLRFAWHLTSVAWFAFAALLVQLAQGPPTSSGVLQVIGWAAIASGCLPLIVTRGRHIAWLVLFIIGGILLYWGAV